MLKLGFERIKNSKQGDLPNTYNDNGYYTYENNATIHYNKDYNKEFPEPRGKVIIYVNTTYKKDVAYVSIKQDGGTRTVYAGVCPTEEFLVQLLNNIR
jgi:hypothetical protein